MDGSVAAPRERQPGRRAPGSGRHRRPLRRTALAAVGVLVSLVLAACSGVPGIYVVEKSGATAAGAPAVFNATTYANSTWGSKIVPAVDKGAVDAKVLLPALAADQAGASKKYGHQAGEGAPFSFLIRGEGTVVGVNNPTGVGSVEVRVPGVTKTVVSIAVGPVLVGTALRDAVGFIDFSQFTNQIDYADAATAINTKVKTEVLKGLDPATLKGKKVTFAGAFQLLDVQSILVTPTKLTVTP